MQANEVLGASVRTGVSMNAENRRPKAYSRLKWYSRKFNFAMLFASPMPCPRRRRAVLRAPFQAQLQFRVPPEPARAFLKPGARFCDAFIHLRRCALLLSPRQQTSPTTHQTFMRDIDHRTRRQRRTGRWHQERSARSTKENASNGRFRCAANCRQVGDRGRPAYSASIGCFIGQSLEDLRY